MRREVWMTNRTYGTWLPAPAINYDGSAQGWSSQMNYLNGGASVRSSSGSHREYNLTWNLASQQELMPVMNFAQGMYGDGLVYYSDPFAHQFNVVQKDWAMPYLGGLDGVILTGTARPQLVDTAANTIMTLGAPARQAIYSNIVTANSKQLWIPIPPGHKLVIRAFGSGSGNASWRVLPDGGAETALPWRSALTDAPNVFQGTTGVSLYLGGSGTNSATCLAVVAQIVEVNEANPVLTQMNAGMGHTGLKFASMPQLSQYSAVLDKVGLTARLVEVGAWR